MRNFTRTLAALGFLAVSAAGARAEGPKPPPPEASKTLPLAWSVPVEASEGWKPGFSANLAVLADGTALLAIPEEKEEGGKTSQRLLVQSVSAAGQVLGRTTPAAAATEYLGSHALAAEADGFALVVNTSPGTGAIFRLARDGSVRAQHKLATREPMNEINGMASDGRGRLIVYGGTNEGPHAPGMAALDAKGRLAWFFAGKHPMPPGGVRAVRFRRDGGSDAVVIDREKPSWERRTAGGALAMRAALPRHWDCWGFLNDTRLAALFNNWEQQATLAVPGKTWVLALIGPNGRMLPNPATFEAPKSQNANCQLAVNDAGWIAATLEPPRIGLYDFSLKLRAEIDLSASGATVIEALAVDAKGAVTVLVDTRPTDQPGRKLMLLRFAAPAP